MRHRRRYRRRSRPRQYPPEEQLRVLLVEDNARLVVELRRTLESMVGTQVVATAATPSEAGRWLTAHPDGWDLAVVDIFLREGHGFDVLRDCRGRRPGQRAIVLSNYTRDPYIG